MVLEAINLHDVLQIDATIIAGLLILLTLLSFKPPPLPKKQEYVSSSEMNAEERRIHLAEMEVDRLNARNTVKVEVASRYHMAMMTVGGISPFSASALIIIFNGSTDYAKYATGVGFTFLIVADSLVFIYLKFMKNLLRINKY